jgi:hypothetical protein
VTVGSAPIVSGTVLVFGASGSPTGKVVFI